MRSVIEMAREAGIEFTYDPTETPVRAFVECWEDEMEKFADLIRADERDRLLKIVYEQSTAYGKPGECIWIGVKYQMRNSE